MDIMEWILLAAILDGPVAGLLYFVWIKFKR